jgi:thioredoxin reductase (NADPH)
VAEGPRVDAAEDALLLVHVDCENFPADPGIPLPSKPFHLSQFGHATRSLACAAMLGQPPVLATVSTRVLTVKTQSKAKDNDARFFAFQHLPRVLSLFMEKVIIVGSGCAGLTAAIYAARANLSPLVLEGPQPGGQLSTTTLVENYPGFPDGIEGPQLILNMHQQAEKFGARFSYAEVEDFDVANKTIRIKSDDEWIETAALIVASGASARWLNLEDEQKLIGHGLTSCATCDGAFYKNVPVCVIGGGDSAAEEALFLTRFASKVYLIHRRDKLRASKIMADRALANPKIEPIWNTVITKYIPDEKGEMNSVRLRNLTTQEERDLPVACVFVAIGHDPNTKPFKGKLETDPEGYLLANRLVESKHAGVFIAGDVSDRVYKQAVTAAGAGCAAAIEAERYLSDLEAH